MRWFARIAALLFALAAAPGFAATLDCPLARQPYSSKTVLLDLLLNPRARAVLDAEAPGLTTTPVGPPMSIRPPTFAAILTPEAVLRLQRAPAEVAARLDAALARVPVTAADMRARCARYDSVPPKLPATIKRPAILLFDKITGFRDRPSVDAAAAALRAMAARRGWTLVSSGNGAVFNARDLARFDAVVWNNVSGDALTLTQRRAFRQWIERGGGFAGFHGSAGDPVYLWDWYADTLIGARFTGHPMAPQFQDARVVVDDPGDPIAAGLGNGWTMSEEWYSFAASPRANGARVIATLDERSYSPVGMNGVDLRMGDHPIAWTRCVGRGRSFYSAIGHRPENYAHPQSIKLLEQGIAWAAGLGDRRCASTNQGAER